MDILETTQDLVEKVAHMVVAQVLCLEKFVQICLHQRLYDVAGQLVSKGTSDGNEREGKGGRG